jgi:hypothetical protein
MPHDRGDQDSGPRRSDANLAVRRLPVTLRSVRRPPTSSRSRNRRCIPAPEWKFVQFANRNCPRRPSTRLESRIAANGMNWAPGASVGVATD